MAISMLRLVISIIAFITVEVCTAKSVMPWLCLERCGSNSSQIADQVLQILNNRELFNKAAFELYNLGPNGTLVTNRDLSPVGPKFVSSGVKSYPMISSYPYPPEFLSWMRQLWDPEHPEIGESFISTCLQEVQSNGWAGLNVDWEPTNQDVAPEDTANYAQFLDKFARRMHAIGGELTVDTGSWSPIWNLTMLAETALDRIITMSTYTSNLTSFKNHFQQSIQQVGYKNLARLGTGLASYNLETNQTWTDADLQPRFDAILSANIQEIDIWLSPIPEIMLSHISSFMNQTESL